MRTLATLVLVVLVLLAVSSGVAKIMLVQQDVEFFGKYGFSSPVLIGFGVAQVLGGVSLIFSQTRFYGAAIVAVTFLVSLTLLLIDGNIPVSVVTLIAILLLGAVMKKSWRSATE